MKFKIEVELDWIGEDTSLDDKIKEELVDGIARKLSGDAIKRLTEDAMRQVNTKLDGLVVNLFEEFIDKGVTVTDRWGDVVKTSVSIRELMKDKLDKALTEKVNKDGKTDTYNAVGTRLEWMIQKRVNEAVQVMTKDVVAQVDATITKRLNEELRKRLSDSLLSKINLDAITESTLASFKK